MDVVRVDLLRSICLICAVFLSACATQLAPRYDEALFLGVTDTNVKIMELFASVETGTDKGTCKDREDVYNAVIGSVDALSLQSRARPVPEKSITKEVNEFLDTRGVGAINEGVAPSADSLEEVSKQLAKMKEVDCKTGLMPGAVAPFKNAVIISMDQAITYESFLAR